MKTKKIIPIGIGAVALVVIALAAVTLNLSTTGNSVQSNQNLQTSQTDSSQAQRLTTSTQAQSTCTKLSDTSYAPYVYLISSDQLSSSAQTALSGFHITKTSLSNGDSTITLGPIGQLGQNITVKAGQILYFIETSFGDDAPQQDSTFRDDSAVLVDSNGCVLG